MKVGDKVRLKQVDSNDDIYIFSWAEYELLRDEVLTIASMRPLGVNGKNSVLQFAYPDEIEDKAPFDGNSFHYNEDIILKKVDNMLTEIV